MAKKEALICNRCSVEMKLMTAHFKYLARSFNYDVHRCPQCGQVFLPEELTKGKIADVEAALEEK